MNIAAHFKGFQAKESGEDNIYALTIHINKSRMTLEALESMHTLQGQAVTLSMTSIERDQYDQVMAKKKAQQQLDLEGQVADLPSGLFLMPLVALTCPEFVRDGKVYFVASRHDNKWGISIHSEKGIECADNLGTWPTYAEAETFLRNYAANEALIGQTPAGFCTIYGDQNCDEPYLIRVIENEEEEEGFPLFRAFMFRPGVAQVALDNLGDLSTFEEAQADLDRLALEEKMPILWYVPVPQPVEKPQDVDTPSTTETTLLTGYLNDGDSIIRLEEKRDSSVTAEPIVLVRASDDGTGWHTMPFDNVISNGAINEGYRLLLCYETVDPGDVLYNPDLENMIEHTVVNIEETGVTLVTDQDGEPMSFEINWTDLDKCYRMLRRA